MVYAYTHTHTHNGILLSQTFFYIWQKPQNFTIHSNMDGLWGHYAKWNKSDTERQILYDVTYVCVLKSFQSCLTLCDLMDCSLPGSSIHRILQASILEWVAMLYSRGSSRPKDGTWVSCVSCIGRQVLYHLGSLSDDWKDPKGQREQNPHCRSIIDNGNTHGHATHS